MNRHTPSESLIERTLLVWQPYAGRQLTDDDACEIIENISGFFLTLIEWDTKEHEVWTPVGDGKDAGRDGIAP